MFIINDGKKIFGPVDFKTIQELVKKKEISENAHVCLNDKSLWVNSIGELLRFNPEKKFLLQSQAGEVFTVAIEMSYMEIIQALQKNEITREDKILLGNDPVPIQDAKDFHPIYTAFAINLEPTKKIERKFKRVNYDPKVIWHNQLEIEHAKLRQIGGGGCFIETLKKIVIGDKVKVHIRPKDLEKPLLVTAEVVAFLKGEGLALKFLDISNQDQGLITKFASAS